MIQFNLLPDVKLQFIKAQRTKRLVISVSILASAVALAILFLLIVSVDGVQKKSLADLDRDITTNSKKLEATPDLNKVLTIQNQLSVLTGLHDQKPASTRLFTYLSQVTPVKATISNITVDYTQNTISITGGADTLDSVNTFADTLKFTTYNTGNNGDGATSKAFNQVVLASFGRTNTGATYNITCNFDPAIFSNANTISLNVPNTITTRSITQQPTDLFKKTTNPSGQ